MDIKIQLDELQKKKGYLLTDIELLKSELFKVQQQICNVMNQKLNNQRIVENMLNRNKGK